MSKDNELSLWAIVLAISVAAVADKEAGRPVGSVRIQEGVTAVIINNRNESITIRGGNKPVGLPVGTYHVDFWMMDRFYFDGQGSPWELKGIDLGKRGIFEVVDGRETQLSIGEPVMSSLTARKEGSTYYVTHSLTGKLSETVQITRNGTRPEAPKLHITSVDGLYQETLTFGYG